jgi:Ca2+-binding RTX toxin-like protein
MLGGDDGDDMLSGGTGKDWLTGGKGDDILNGDADDDVLDGSMGADILDGGAGFDRAIYWKSEELVDVDLMTGLGRGGDAEGDWLTGIEWLEGSAYGDRLAGDNGANRLTGAGGTDTLIGAGGDDTLSGQDDGDLLFGDAGKDWLFGDKGDDYLDGGDGDDTLDGGLGIDELVGGAGWDRALYWRSTSGVTVDLMTGTGQGGDAEGDTLSGIEWLEGSAFADNLSGDDAVNWLTGAGGDDILYGAGGDDTLGGGDGADMLDGGDGIDWLAGNGGDDVLGGGAGDDVLDGNAGADWMDGGEGWDRATYWKATAGIEVDLLAGLGLAGEAGGDILINIEALEGSAFDDVLGGDDGANALYGGIGNDRLSGRGGDDLLNGGKGADRYDFARGDGNDRIVDDDGAGTADRLVFGNDIARDQLWFERAGNDLRISILGTDDRVNVDGWYASTARRLDTIETTDGSVLVAAQVERLRSAMAGIAAPLAGQMQLSAEQQAALDPVIATSWQ